MTASPPWQRMCWIYPSRKKVDGMISFEGVNFAYRKGEDVLSGISLQIALHKVILVTGENGAGKSTFASLAAGILRPDAGQVCFSGLSLPKCKPAFLYQRISYLRQRKDENLLGITPQKDLSFWLTGAGFSEVEIREQVMAALSAWDLADKKDVPLWELSAGELKRVLLAGISLHPKRFWILDEPLAELDAAAREKVFEMLARKKQNRFGYLVVSHRSDGFSSLADEIWEVKDRTIIRMENQECIS